MTIKRHAVTIKRQAMTPDLRLKTPDCYLMTINMGVMTHIWPHVVAFSDWEMGYMVMSDASLSLESSQHYNPKPRPRTHNIDTIQSYSGLPQMVRKRI